MAEHPWRCSQCGTINEPVANSCRTCGKWPSLFDLEDSAVEEGELYTEPALSEPDPGQAYDAPEPLTVQTEAFEPEPFEPEPPAQPAPRRRGMFEAPTTEPVLEEGEGKRPRWVSWIVPVAVVVYLAIQYAVSGR